MEKLKGTMRLSMVATHRANKKLNSLEAQLVGTNNDDNVEDDNASQSSLSQYEIADFFMGAQF